MRELYRVMTAPLPTDLEIAHAATLRPLVEVAADLGLTEDHLEPWGRGVAKIDLSVLDEPDVGKRAKYVVVTAITPTPLGEGKTTTSVGLAQALGRLGQRAVVALRQPSMGPTFGIKGGAAGGGYSQVVPMERLNLHLTGDFHAVTAAHNLLSAMIDNHLHHGNKLGIDVRNITWRRVMDVNDRALRTVIVGIGAREDGLVRQTGFDITAASEVMVLLTLATSLEDLRLRLGRIVVAYTVEGKSVTADDLRAAGAMAVILQDALKPNLLQTLEGGPAIIHCGPFGNIATGTSSVIADLVGVRGSDYVITEAGFGADMGAERFFNVKCRVSGLAPDAAVLVATVRALKAHSGHWTIKPGKPLPDGLLDESPEEVQAGLPNLRKHIEIIQRFGIQPVVAINAFPTDFDSEHAVIRELCDEMGVRCAVTRHVAEGGAGALELARVVTEAAEEPTDFRFLYPLEMPLVDKIDIIAREVYGADGIDVGSAAGKALKEYERLGFGNLPVVIAKTHLSISSDPSRKGAPTGWRLPVREVRAAVGAGYVYAICGDMRTMPGLPKSPNAERIDLTEEGSITGLS
jgi:formate--tetrahydrofolate ligase